MPKQNTELQKALGRLISAIQKEWGEQLGETHAAEFSEDVMNSAHRLLQAKTDERVKKLLGTFTVRQYIGDIWVQAHPKVKIAIENVENALANTSDHDLEVEIRFC